MSAWKSVVAASCALLATVSCASATSHSLARASAEACRVDISAALIPIAQHGEEAGEEQRRARVSELAGRWRGRFNRFASGSHAKVLRGYADALYRPAAPGAARYAASACRILRPLSAVAVSGSFVADAIGGIRPGRVLVRCASGLCVPAAVAAIAHRCDFTALAVPVAPICGTQRIERGKRP